MDVIKKSYHPFRMWNEQNGATSVHGNTTVNTPVLVIRTRLWSSSEMHGHHVLNVFRLYTLWDVRWSEILPNRYIISVWKLSFFRMFFGFLLCFVPKIMQPIWYKLIIC